MISEMRSRDTFDVMTSLVALVADALAIFAGFLLATWVRFDSGWIPMRHEGLPPRMLYVYAAAVAALLFLFIFRQLGLYVRPQIGNFGDKIPRIVRATAWGIFLAVALAFAIRTEPPFSRYVAAISFLTVSVLVVAERYILFHIELLMARQRQVSKQVLIIGTDHMAARLKEMLESEPRLRSKVVAFLRTSVHAPDPAIPADLIRGNVADLETIIDRHEVDQAMLTDTTLPHARMSEIILKCEQNLVDFQLVPDLFRVLTSKVDVQNIGEIPLLGIKKWPLDYFWNRAMKRAEDIIGSLLGLAVSAPIFAVSAIFIKRSSPGPVFYRQDRCGEGGRTFIIHKLRTMPVGAEAETGPVWASQDDPRRTRVGTFLRRHNLDELPQFWNVLKGNMSLVGPRPERPFFVEQFKEDISRYMWRHSSKPGITGWAQVNGLRGNTSIQDRIQYDLYYLENWSLAFDFKILVKTFFALKNAY